MDLGIKSTVDVSPVAGIASQEYNHPIVFLNGWMFTQGPLGQHSPFFLTLRLLPLEPDEPPDEVELPELDEDEPEPEPELECGEALELDLEPDPPQFLEADELGSAVPDDHESLPAWELEPLSPQRLAWDD